MPNTPTLRERIADLLREADDHHCHYGEGVPYGAMATAVEHLLLTEVATAVRDAADFVRHGHFVEGLSPQEIGTALRHRADRTDPNT